MADLIETQMNVIGSLIIDITSIKKVYGVLQPEHFTHAKLKKVYSSILELYTLGKHIDVQSIANNARTNNLTEYDLSELIKQCYAHTTTSAGIEYHAKELADNYKSRQFRDIVREAYNIDERNVNEVVGDTINKLTELASERKTSSKTLREAYQENKHKYFNEDYNPEYLNLGFDDIDNMISGIEDTDLVCIAARPSIGKSAFVTQVALNQSKQGKKVIFYNLEMKDKQVIDRMIASEAGIPFDRVRHAKNFMGDEELRFRDAEERVFNSTNLIINDSGSQTVGQIRNECKYIDGLGLIIIDYLQLITPEGNRRGNKVQEIGDISRGLKALAMELKVPVIALSQMSRNIESRNEKEPVLSDLRESGDIEQDCNIVIFLYELDSEEDKKQYKKGAKVAKSRQGRTGKCKLVFKGEYMTFYDTEGFDPYSKPKDNKTVKDDGGFMALAGESSPFGKESD